MGEGCVGRNGRSFSCTIQASGLPAPSGNICPRPSQCSICRWRLTLPSSWVAVCRWCQPSWCGATGACQHYVAFSALTRGPTRVTAQLRSVNGFVGPARQCHKAPFSPSADRQQPRRHGRAKTVAPTATRGQPGAHAWGCWLAARGKGAWPLRPDGIDLREPRCLLASRLCVCCRFSDFSTVVLACLQLQLVSAYISPLRTL